MKKIIITLLCFAFFLMGYNTLIIMDCNASSWQEISSFTTDFTYSVPQRKHNIRLSASKLDGIVLKSGESLSFNKVVGNRTQSNGYQVSTVIENGVYTGGVGGGVCQTSTTLYNAVIRAGLKVKEVHPHSLSPEYVDASFDAMVSSEGSDFVFKNIYSYPIKITASTKDDKLIFKIYATNKIDGLEIIPYCDIIKTIAPPQTMEKTDVEFPNVNVACGEVFSYRISKMGKLSKGYIMYKYKGKVIRIKQIRNDHYLPVQGINILGTNSDADLQNQKTKNLTEN
ncbi:MAG: VanW family protein [Bacillota bacterium]